MLKFNKGDHVRVIATPVDMQCFLGHAGRVIKIDLNDDTPYLVLFDQCVHELCMDWTDTWFKEHELARERQLR